MKTLYLHGLYAKPAPEKISILENDYGLDVIAPEIDYEKYAGSLDLFDSLSGQIKKEKIMLIVGSSFGGYLGFHLSEFCSIPGYLFNPALIKKSLEIPVRMQRADVKKYVILGKHDDIVDPKKTKEYLWENKFQNTFVIEQDFGHQTDPALFRALLELTDLIYLR